MRLQLEAIWNICLVKLRYTANLAAKSFILDLFLCEILCETNELSEFPIKGYLSLNCILEGVDASIMEPPWSTCSQLIICL